MVKMGQDKPMPATGLWGFFFLKHGCWGSSLVKIKSGRFSSMSCIERQKKINPPSCCLTLDWCLHTPRKAFTQKKSLWLFMPRCVYQAVTVWFMAGPVSLGDLALKIPAGPSSVDLSPGSEDVPPPPHPHSFINTGLHWPLLLVG